MADQAGGYLRGDQGSQFDGRQLHGFTSSSSRSGTALPSMMPGSSPLPHEFLYLPSLCPWRISSCRFTQQPGERAGCAGGGSRVLSGDEIAVHNHVRLKVTGFGIDAAVALEHVFDQERYCLREANGLFFGIAEARDFLSINQQCAVRGPDIAQGAWRVANGSHRLVRREHAPDQTNRRTILGKVPQRAVTSRVKHC